MRHHPMKKNAREQLLLFQRYNKWAGNKINHCDCNQGFLKCSDLNVMKVCGGGIKRLTSPDSYTFLRENFRYYNSGGSKTTKLIIN